MRIRNKTLALSVSASVAALLAAGAAIHAESTAQPAAGASVPAPAAVPLMTAPNYRAIVARNQAAVVGITTAGSQPTANEDNPLSQFFPGLQIPRNRGVLHAQGSGFIISPDGIVLTNAHVVDGAKQVTVRLADHREYKARVLGADRSSDIAVLKIDAHDLPTVQLGNSDAVGVGDYVLAIGEPFGLEETATAGIVSAKGRSLPGDGYVPFIQTDAAVNPGNSGGPLFDAGGAVVGINAQIYSNSGGYQGVSFAIPINLAVQIKDQIVKTGKVSHARLGVEVQSLDQSLADSFGLPTVKGALIAKVAPDSAAARAGLRSGDVILAVNGTPIADAGQLSARIGSAVPGDAATLSIWRGGKAQTVNATVAAAKGDAIEASNDSASGGKLGLALRPLDPAERSQAGVPGGLLVQDARGPAADAGIQPGDVVLSVNGTPVTSVEQLRTLAQSHHQIALLIQRGSERLFVPVGLG